LRAGTGSGIDKAIAAAFVRKKLMHQAKLIKKLKEVNR
jgi:hypothetical protein